MFCKLMRLGNQPDIRFTPKGDAVMNLSLAYSYGRKGEDGKRPTQWLEAALFGKQAQAVQPYLHKGDQVSVSVDDLHIETYEGKNGTGHKLVGRIVAFDFVSGKQDQGTITNELNSPQAAPAQPFAPTIKGGVDDFDSDIPF